jgi:signal transduction histidine kinase
MEPVEVGEVLKSVQQSFAPKAEEGSVSIVVEGGGATVTADRDRLVQVLSNLVENALRYTPAKGTITLSSSTAGGWVRLQVADTGPGFQAEDFGRAFERQFLWNKYRGLRDVGTGLGLAITKELTEAMGGRVGASTAPGGGAVFVVELVADG